jgi:hypothetical protein
MDSSNQKWKFHIMARTNRMCSEKKDLSNSSATVKGHLNQQRMNTTSTKMKEERNMVTTEWGLDYGIKTNCIYAATIDA